MKYQGDLEREFYEFVFNLSQMLNITQKDYSIYI